MLFYVSIANYDTGEFVGAAYINAETAREAEQGAVNLVPPTLATSVNVRSCRVPPGGPAIPAIGRLLRLEDIVAMGPTVRVSVDRDTGDMEVTKAYDQHR